MSKYTQRRPEEFQPAPACEKTRPMCSTPGCKTYVGKGKCLPSFADIIVPNDGIRLCGECYLSGLYAAGKGSMSEITGRQQYLTPELVKAHWDRLGAADKAKEAK